MNTYEGKYFAFIGAIRWLLKPYANYEGKFNFKQKIMGIKAGLWSDLLEWLMFCWGQGLLTRDLSSFFYSSHSLRVILLITCILLFHCEYPPPHRGLFTRGLALPGGRACPRRPHPGLDPWSPANITTELLRHRDYNQKKNSFTLFLCVYSEKYTDEIAGQARNEV